MKCVTCGSKVETPESPVAGEIFTCPDCGAEYEVKVNNGKFTFVELDFEGEDWGE